jgi:hypothetical protein
MTASTAGPGAGGWHGVLSSRGAALADAAVELISAQLRPDMVALTDAFELPDRVLNSTIGRYDGNAYEAVYASTRINPLNKPDVFEGHRVVGPMLDKEFLALKNGLSCYDEHEEEEAPASRL